MGMVHFFRGLKTIPGHIMLSLLCLLLILLPFWRTASVLAAPVATSYEFGLSQKLDRTSVSVVRVFATYGQTLSAPGGLLTPTPGKNKASSSPCSMVNTGLGVLVGSWLAPTGSNYINWVLTDSAVLNPFGMLCAQKTAHSPLSGIELVASTAFTATSSALALHNIQCPASAPVSLSCGNDPMSCQQTAPSVCAGAVLLAFQTPFPMPYVDVAAVGQSGSASGIALLDPNNPTALTPTTSEALQFLTPSELSLNGTNGENGLPLVIDPGKLLSLHLARPSSELSITTFITTTLSPARLEHVNPLQTAWDQSITDYYQKQPGAVASALQKVANLNPHFGGLTMLLERVSVSPAGKKSSTTNTPKPADDGLTVQGLHFSYQQISIAGAVVLAVLLLLLILLFSYKRAQRRAAARKEEGERLVAEQRMSADRMAAERQVALNAQHFAEEQARRQQLWPPSSPLPSDVQELPPSAMEFVQSPQEGLASLSISDLPTIEMASRLLANGQVAAETTLPYSQQAQPARKLGLSIGMRSDPGLKRKHKPNEDSFFAAQGLSLTEPQQQYGLFVIADGMGGHASGQDASRTAIQTIIRQLLPRIITAEEIHDEAYVRMLTEGVQMANQAVHQRNMEFRADMGTTMTGALIVGSTAYVANVGDSRTYLYRESEGLKKITNDHSVVASLVEAGIIKPDDIYTHPKRNQIYRSLGEKPVIEVDTFVVQLLPGDKLLLCSDGLWDMVRDPEIQHLMQFADYDPLLLVNDLIEAAYNGGGEDNVSVILVYVHELRKRLGMHSVSSAARADSVTTPYS